jgi:DNA-binding NarL/FixJ family response regulator
MAERLTIVLVEASYLIQAGIDQLIHEMPQMYIVETFDGTEKKLLEKIQQKKPDIIIINPFILKDDFVSIINQLKKNDSCLVGLVDRNTSAKLCSPFHYCLNINDDKYELLEILKKISGNRVPHHDKKQIISELSEREITLLKQVVYGLTNQEIADKLFLSIHTVTTHRKNITRKLGIKTVSGLTVFALMNKIIDLKDIEQK